MNLKDLKKPFPADDIEWRIGRCGEKNGKPWAMALAYITARAIHDRLDDVCGVHGWQLRYKEHLDETVCEIGVKVGEEWIWKAGGGDKTEFEAFKGGLSSAEKRAGVPWGIGRYLYNLTETFVETSSSKKEGWRYQSKSKNAPAFWWKIPTLPDWALPEKNPTNYEKDRKYIEKQQEALNQEKPKDVKIWLQLLEASFKKDPENLESWWPANGDSVKAECKEKAAEVYNRWVEIKNNCLF